MYICNSEPSMGSMALSLLTMLFSKSNSFSLCKQTVVGYLLSGLGFFKSTLHFNSHFVDTSFTTIGTRALATNTYATFMVKLPKWAKLFYCMQLTCAKPLLSTYGTVLRFQVKQECS